MTKKMPFTECVDIVGTSVKNYDGVKKYISTGAVDCDHIDYSQVETFTYKEKPARANLAADRGTILFAKMQGTKKTLVLDEDMSQFMYSTGFAAVRPKQDVISERCLYHLVSGTDFLLQKDKHCSGATQKAITNKGLEKIIISIPDISSQAEIAHKLDDLDASASVFRNMRKRLDDLVKSRQVGMIEKVAA